MGTKVHKIELMIIDHDDVGVDDIKIIIEQQKYPNRCINPRVMETQTEDIGEWDDDHPLNSYKTMSSEYNKLFPKEITKVFGLIAKGDYANFRGSGAITSKKVYLAQEQAELETANFLNYCCDGSLGALDITNTQVYVIEYDIKQ